MNYIESYLQQTSDKTTYYSTDIFNEYCGLNCFLNDYPRENDEIKEAIELNIAELTEQDHQLIEKSISIIKETIQTYESSNHPLMFYDFDGVIFLYGDKTVDAQGIRVRSKTYMVVDLLAYAQSIDKYNPKSFVVHELIHPIQYKMNSGMYFRQFESREQTTLSRLWLEGLATYLTKHHTTESETDIFWLGYLDDDGVKKWIDQAHKRKNELGQLILNCSSDWSLHSQLECFSIPDPELMWQGRLAYYYGYEIIKELHKRYNINKIIVMDYEDIKGHIKAYFNGDISAFNSVFGN
jgi:hypothetical protein